MKRLIVAAAVVLVTASVSVAQQRKEVEKPKPPQTTNSACPGGTYEKCVSHFSAMGQVRSAGNTCRWNCK